MGRAFLLVVIAACAKAGAGGEDPVVDSRPQGDGGFVGAECPAGQLATDVRDDGTVACAATIEPTRAAIAERCAVFFGARDSCGTCTTPPAKWGRAGGTCANGAGAGNTCTAPDLAGAAPPLFGLDLDGDVDENDKLYGGLHCAPLAATGGGAPCPAGEFVSGRAGEGYACTSLASAVVDHVRASCSLVLGWRDGCADCALPPAKLGRAGDAGCEVSAGVSSCTTAALGTESVNLFGLDLDGNVDENDKLYVGLDCAAATATGGPSTGTCPPGQFVTGVLADGQLGCASIAPQVAQFVTERCTVHFGWRDGCDGCLLPPVKFGQVRAGACQVGAGAGNTCVQVAVGGRTVEMFGLDLDGDVDENDVLYISFACP